MGSYRELLLPAAVIAGAIVFLAMQHWKTGLKVVFVFILFEGAVRKWILPGAADLVYFIKDVILIGVYLGFWTRGMALRRSLDWTKIPIPVFKVTLLPLAILAFNPNVGSVSAGLLGARGYFFYLPIFFIVPFIFNSKQDMLRQLSVYALLAIPVCLLGVLQSRSDSFSVLNTYASGTSEWGASTFGGGQGRVRVTGTFSYLSGHVVFVSVFFALTLALITNPSVQYRKLLTYVSLPLLVGNAFMSGSRAAFLAIAVIAVGFTLTKMGALSAAGKKQAVRTTVAIAFAGVALAGYFFYDAVDALYQRSQRSRDSVKIRLVDSTIHHIDVAWEHGGVLGAGLGTTSPAVRALRRRLRLPEPQYSAGFYDMEIGQVLAEGGLAGFSFWYCFRISVLLAIGGIYRSCRDEQLRTFALATLLLSFPFMVQSLVFNHVACVLLWGMAGVSLAAMHWSVHCSPEPLAATKQSASKSEGSHNQPLMQG
ncbi:hypothetical protein [Rosistilla oblonga]|uniref:hypothetical protein n=1 Tax=Rosistilla oblonga TaxID=2527990 RepID=UPI003A9736BD